MSADQQNSDAQPQKGAGPENKVPTTTELDPLAASDDELLHLVQGGTVVIGEEHIQLKNRQEPGVEVKIRPIRTRALLAVSRILTGSMRPVNVYNLLEPFFTARTDEQQNAAAAAAVTQLLITVPHSEREFIMLIQRLVVPVDRLDEKSRELDAIEEYLDDPEMEDTINIIAQAMVNERPRMGALGKQLMALNPVRARVEKARVEAQLEKAKEEAEAATT